MARRRAAIVVQARPTGEEALPRLNYEGACGKRECNADRHHPVECMLSVVNEHEDDQQREKRDDEDPKPAMAASPFNLRPEAKHGPHRNQRCLRQARQQTCEEVRSTVA